MKIDYGPPAVAGVKHLQYLSANEPDYVSGALGQYAHPVGVAALGVWGFAWITGQEKLKRTALGVSIGAFIVGIFTRE
jgi:C4-dicarboxylate transporter